MIIRNAISTDVISILGLIKELATFEREPHAVVNTVEELSKDLFEDQVCEAIVCEIDSEIVGFALYYVSYSTWKGRCLYLEDLYVKESHRRMKIGDVLFDKVVNLAKERKYRRMDWQVLDWNEPAIKFYNKKGATLDAEWINGRLFFD